MSAGSGMFKAQSIYPGYAVTWHQLLTYTERQSGQMLPAVSQLGRNVPKSKGWKRWEGNEPVRKRM